MKKRLLNIEKDFEQYVHVYDINAKDYFGNSFYIAVNTITYNVRFIAKYKDYSRKRKYYDTHRLQYIYCSKYGDVIDLTSKTLGKIKEEFYDYKLPIGLQIWE